MTGIIRKVSIGPDYKSNAMHYIVGQKVLGDSNTIINIMHDDEWDSIKIFVKNDIEEITLWKEFNSTIPRSIEYNIDF